MLQHVVSAVPQRVGGVGHRGVLGELFRVVREQHVYFNAQDVFQLCASLNYQDTLDMGKDHEFIRGLAASFKRADQSVLTPFQVNVVIDTFTQLGIYTTGNEITVPDEETVSPESLLNVLHAMLTQKMRNDKHIDEVIRLMNTMLDDFTGPQLATACRLFAYLKCTDASFVGKCARRAVDLKEELSILDIATLTSAVAAVRCNHQVLLMVFGLAESRCAEFKFDDYENVLRTLQVVGPKYKKTLEVLTSHALDHVETMYPNCLSEFLSCFVTLEYKNRDHIEIFIDAIIEKARDLKDLNLCNVMLAVLQLNVMSPSIFRALSDRAMMSANTIDVRNIAPIMDVCSQVPYDSATLMHALMNRAADNFMVLTPRQLGDILECLSTYPAAREHRIVPTLGKQVRRRVELMGPPPLAAATKALAWLGYNDPEFYAEAAQIQIRWGFKDYTILEPILQGLTMPGVPTVDPRMVRILGSHMKPMTKQMTLAEVERANSYMVRLQCEDERVFSALAERIRVFVKEVTSDMPEELQQLLQRVAAQPPREHRQRRHHNPDYQRQ